MSSFLLTYALAAILVFGSVQGKTVSAHTPQARAAVLVSLAHKLSNERMS